MNDMNPVRQHGPGLTVEVIDTNKGLNAIEAEWNALASRDPHSNHFLSWDWLSDTFIDNPYRWSVLAVRESGTDRQLVGLLPLKYRTHWSTTRNEFQTELEAGGRLIFSEYTGFLCDPVWEEPVLETLAKALRAMPWSKLSMRYVAQHQRAKQFCAAFERFDFQVNWKEYRINSGETDNLICPQVTLKDDFETYLKQSVSANTRQRYRRFKRQYFSRGEYHFTHTDAVTLDRDIDILMGFWMQKWGPEKGEKSARKVAANFRKVLLAAHRTEALFLPMLWRGDTPLASLGHVMDPKEGAMHFIIAGRNTDAEEPFLGAALHFHSIECAILLGCQVYDFGHGDEAYKFSYGAQPTRVHYFSVGRSDGRSDQVFDSLCTGDAMRRIEGFIKAGKTDRARRACRQLSQVFR